MATPDGRVIQARAVHPRPHTVKITKDAVTYIKMGPWNSSQVITQGSEGKPSHSAEEIQPTQAEDIVPRSFRITQELLGMFVHTKGCPKCEAQRRGDEHKTVYHSRECSKQLETEMNKDEFLSKKLTEVDEGSIISQDESNRLTGKGLETIDRMQTREGQRADQRPRISFAFLPRSPRRLRPS